MPSPERVQRFRVVFRDIAGVTYQYYVCTWFGAHKALVIAAITHDHAVASSKRVYDVADVALVDGDAPAGTDLVDRNEW